MLLGRTLVLEAAVLISIWIPTISLHISHNHQLVNYLVILDRFQVDRRSIADCVGEL